MTGASKILTVSYGTFSCTLEGFDDPFNTMKAIAEYFRDLAAEDRYFGAEPPTPDAAMLHRIAEREIHRRVEAKIQDNGVILRAAEEGAPSAATPALANTALAAPDAGPTPKITMPAAAPARAAALPASETPSLAEAEPAAASAAAKLQRIRAAQEAAPVAPVVAAPPVEAATSAALDIEAPAPVADTAEDVTDDILAAIAAQASDATPAAAPEVKLGSTSAVAYRAEEAFEDMEPTPDFDLTALAASADDGAMPATFAEDFDAIAPDTVLEDAVLEDADEADLADLALLDGVDLEQPAVEFADTEAGEVELVEETFGSETFEDVEPEAATLVADVPAADLYDDESQAALPMLDDLAGDEEDSDDFLNGESFLAALNEPQPEAIEQSAAEHPSAEHPAAAPEFAASDDEAMLANLSALIDPEEEDEASDSLFAEDMAPLAATEAETADSEAPDAMVAAVIEDLAAEPRVAESTPSAMAEAEAEQPAAPAVGEKLQRARARVIRIRRSEAPAAEPVSAATPIAEAPVVEATTAEAPLAEVAAKPLASLLSPEAEAALQAELAELEAELGGPQAADAAEATPQFETDLTAELAAPEEAEAVAEAAPEADPVTSHDPSEALPAIDSERGDDAVSRLIAQTNTAMDGADTRRRQSAIAHLKAAVAATEADRQLRGGASSAEGETRMEAYRNDLERVVRPSRPAAAGTSTERPSPLVLVSEQRIDRPKAAEPAAPAPVAAAPVVPVRPRRVSSSLALQPQVLAEAVSEADEDEDLSPEEALNLFADSKGFEDFADRLGATRLPDLLEAAAVYCAEVLNRPEFSRPLLMHQVTAVPGGASLSREDCLRSFGTLLRQGRITKLKRGQFALTDRSPYLAEAKRIAG